MKMDECHCSYHAGLTQQALSKQMQSLNMTLSNGNLLSGSSFPNTSGDDYGNKKNGVKRNFSNIDTLMEINKETQVQQVRKRTKSEMHNESELESMEFDDGGVHNNQNPLSCENATHCTRCQNGEPGHYSHISSSNVEYVKSKYGCFL